MTNGIKTIIAPMSGRAFELDAGDIISITDVDGGQPGDFMAFDRNDFTVRFGQARTRVENTLVHGRQRRTMGHDITKYNYNNLQNLVVKC